MKRSNKIIVVGVMIFFVVTAYLYREHQQQKAEEYLPHRYKSTACETPTNSPFGLVFANEYLWISSTNDRALLKYDLATERVVESFELPCKDPKGLTFDGENFWVADYGDSMIYKVSPTGEVIETHKTPYSTPYGVAWDGEALWILDVYAMEELPPADPHGEEKILPNSLLYRYDPKTDTVLKEIDSPAHFSGDIVYENAQVIVTGYTSRKVFYVDVDTGETTDWYYPPDTSPRAIAIGKDNMHYLSGMETREIWKINLNERAQRKDLFGEGGPMIPFWLIIIAVALLFPVVLDELVFSRKDTQ